MTATEQDATRAHSDRLAHAASVAERLLDNIETVIHGKRSEIRLVLAALACEGHVLLEDVPGTAKTVLARAIAQSVEGASTSRIQCTPDLQPTDVTGLSIYNQRERDFEFRPGPIFANVVLVDEINRAMPKTQSALLEAMAERQVTVDGATRELPEAVPAARDREPDRARGHVPAAGSAARPFLPEDGARLPARRRRAPDPARPARRPPARAARPVLTLDGRLGAAGRRARGVHRRDPPALGRRPRARDARARRGRDRRVGARVARARARGARVGAHPRARLRRAGRRAGPVPAGRRPPLRLHARVPRRGPQARLGADDGGGAAALPRDRAAARRRLRRRRCFRSPGVRWPIGVATFPLVPATAPDRARLRGDAERAGAAAASTSSARARTARATTCGRSTGARRRGSRRRAARTSSSSASASPRRRRASWSSATGGRRWRSSRRACRGSRSRRRCASPAR